jgi:hypothetical protein
MILLNIECRISKRLFCDYGGETYTKSKTWPSFEHRGVSNGSKDNAQLGLKLLGILW